MAENPERHDDTPKYAKPPGQIRTARSFEVTNEASSQKEKFDRNYLEICKYIGKDGKLILCRNCPKTRYLANWMIRQFKRVHLTIEQREKLEHLKAHYDSRPRQEKDDASWNEHLTELVKYKAECHTIKIQKRDKQHRRLYDWSERQKKLIRENRLAPERTKQLVNVGFDVSQIFSNERTFTKKQEKEWNNRYEELARYKEKHGHCRVSYNDTENDRLANWVSKQRVIFRRGNLALIREQKLNEIGFIWSIRHPHSYH